MSLRQPLIRLNFQVMKGSADERTLLKFSKKIEEDEPKMQSPFNKQQYNAWRKEVYKETIRTSMKLEHYKKSELLLQAI